MNAFKKMLCLSSLMLVPLASACTQEGFDGPGNASFKLQSANRIQCATLEGLPEGRAGQMVNATAYFSSLASEFGPQGVLISAQFDLDLGDEGSRHAMLMLDVDFSGLDQDGTVKPHAMQVTYFETDPGGQAIAAKPVMAEIKALSLRFPGKDDGQLEIAFSLAVQGPEACRLLLEGSALAKLPEAQPAKPQTEALEPERVETGCGGFDWIADDGDDDAAWDSDIDDGEGDTWEDDWEGDTWDEDDDWEGDTWDEDESGLTFDDGEPVQACSIMGDRSGRGPRISRIFALFPHLLVLMFIGWLRRRLHRV